MSEQADQIIKRTQSFYMDWSMVAHEFTSRRISFLEFAQASDQLLRGFQLQGLLPRDQTIEVGLSLAENSAMALGYQKTFDNGRSFNPGGIRHIEKVLLFSRPYNGSFQKALEIQLERVINSVPFTAESPDRLKLIKTSIDDYRTGTLGFQP